MPSYQGPEHLWPGMDPVCSQCAKRGVPSMALGDQVALCDQPLSPFFQNPVGYHGPGCDFFTYPGRQTKETQDTTRKH